MIDLKSWAALIAVALATSGCELADRLEGSSPNRETIERRDALTAPPTPAPVEPVLLVAPPAPVAPVCRRDENGVLSCD